MYTEVAIEFYELKIVILRVAKSIGEWLWKFGIICFDLLVHEYVFQ